MAYLYDIYISNIFYERDYLILITRRYVSEQIQGCCYKPMGADMADINNDGKADACY
jgi:hypothetical protein